MKTNEDKPIMTKGQAIAILAALWLFIIYLIYKRLHL
jgi:hypothetical protein